MTGTSPLASYRAALRGVELMRRLGWVRQMQGLSIESQGPDATVGELCRIRPRQQAGQVHPDVLAEVVGLRGDLLTLMPYGSLQGVSAGAEVIAVGRQATFGVGPALLGRVIDGFGRSLDSLPDPVAPDERPLHAHPINPMQRPRIHRVLQTGVRCLDGLLTLGQGQRVGIFAGSGVGKSTLLGMIARHVVADVNVIALIGERGREVREFIDKQLGPEGLKRSVVVVATSDQPALARIRAAHAAVTIAEYFRDAGQQVLLTMDSVTRLAMARREVGLAAGEPPTARGYTPSVFAELPQLCERCGTAPSGGSITALFTVLVEGDDMNEPIADSLRSILDGHVVLSRDIAHEGRYPAVDVLRSASRLLPDLTSSEEQELISDAVRYLALLHRNRQLVDIGAYEQGANPELDHALSLAPALQEWLSQKEGGVSRAEAMRALRTLLWPDRLAVAAPRPPAAAIHNFSYSLGSQKAAGVPKGAR
ncbi:FliI/YscN family ATPase [Paracidovorax konjaci]|uniref:Type III secretion system ATPase, FliI/YscN n=1 Tax=Paracidovorax konjaci TaxID=32040 RepID=A0A1I1WGE0_9BURK|nr:FliI/YscN family ATPase [Paracidovorax konjaci]SFD93468.1 type III secretion system ATPase, FliI/YscN [Paracidovorax konjaci]